VSGVKRAPSVEKPKAAPKPAPKPVAAPPPEGEAGVPVVHEEEAAAPEVTPQTSTVPFHKDTLTLPERMQMAEEMGGGLETKLFAAMAQTDCGACGWDCEGYAKAIATGETKDISLCTPGESETLDMLKKLMEEAGKEFEGA
jgi:sulfite reductase (NADPH) flavoprotein alpha-component